MNTTVCATEQTQKKQQNVNRAVDLAVAA